MTHFGRALLLFKPEAFRLMELEQQNPLEVATQIARYLTGYPALSAEAVSVDIDELGAPYIDDANPNTAGKVWFR
jgi:hypothetical protein